MYNSRWRSGKKGWMRSKVAFHSAACSGLRDSSWGGRRKPEAFMTSNTFFKSSGTASYCDGQRR